LRCLGSVPGPTCTRPRRAGGTCIRNGRTSPRVGERVGSSPVSWTAPRSSRHPTSSEAAPWSWHRLACLAASRKCSPRRFRAPTTHKNSAGRRAERLARTLPILGSSAQPSLSERDLRQAGRLIRVQALRPRERGSEQLPRHNGQQRRQDRQRSLRNREPETRVSGLVRRAPRADLQAALNNVFTRREALSAWQKAAWPGMSQARLREVLSSCWPSPP
jgi:hypothetical protein